MTLKTQPKEINLDLFGESGITITEFVSKESEKLYRLRWTDYVINVWDEHYDSLATALARVATLAHCLQDEDSMLGFKHDPDRFTNNAIKFLEGAVA